MFIKVKLHSNSKKQRFEKISDNKFEIWVKKKAERNEANIEMLNFLAKIFNCSVNQLRIVSGHHRPSKTLELKE